jgi:tRNA-uridine 2-sulfurtransferase
MDRASAEPGPAPGPARRPAGYPGAPRPRVRALGLLSGGLDSALAAALLLEQGLDVAGLHFESPVSCRSDVRGLARELGIPLIVRAQGEAFLELLRAPRWGYGRNLNPCLDCRILMLRRAGEVMRETGAAFLFTGEVPGQRPMSQLGGRLRLVERQSGLEGLLLRPLSAKLLPETEPERRGWVDRARLLAIHGRSRRVQLAEAARLGLVHHGSPGGGCLLTEPAYARRLRDLLEHSPAGLDGAEVELLAVGRHFRCGPGLKIVLGRDATENARLAAFQDGGRWLLEPHDVAGPSALVCGPRDEETLERAAALVTRYARTGTPGGPVRWRTATGDWTRPAVSAAAPGAPVTL